MPRGERAFGTQDAAAPSSVVGATSPPLLNDTIGSSLRSAVERYPTNPAVISAHQGVRRSYEQLWADVQAAARSLLAIGTCHGDRIALWAPTSLEWTVVQYAAASIGAILVTLNPAYRHSELAFALQSAEVAVLVLGETFKAESMVAVAQDALRDAPCVRSLVVLGDDAPPGWLTWDAFRSAGQSAALGARLAALGAQLLPWDAVNIQYTSGTTGRPKAATLSHHNIVNNAAMVGGVLGYGPSDRVCIPVPLFHCFGQVMGNLACIAYGATAVYPARNEQGMMIKTYGATTQHVVDLDGVLLMAKRTPLL